MKQPSILIIGAGFTGLSAALRLRSRGFAVTIVESASRPGGLAASFKAKKWHWTLEHYYHHLFTSDYSIRNLAKELNYPLDFTRPKTATFVFNQISQLDSPSSLLSFPALSFIARIRTGLVLAFLKITPFWQSLEKITAYDFLLRYGGLEAWNVLWKPLFTGKFGKHYKSISATWFWARIKKRSAYLGYPRGGFGRFIAHFAKIIAHRGVEIRYNLPVKKVRQNGKSWRIELANGEILTSDFVLSTLPTPLFLATTVGLPRSYHRALSNMQGIGGLNLVLSLKHSLIPGIYWLNINDPHMPYLAIVEHTNFVSRAHYGGDYLVYIGSYLDKDSAMYQTHKDQLIREYLPHLRRINPNFKLGWIKSSWIFRSPFTQPIVKKNFAKLIPSITTPLSGLFLANLQQVYPWDRGTNYAIELGEKSATIITKYFEDHL